MMRFKNDKQRKAVMAKMTKNYLVWGKDSQGMISGEIKNSKESALKRKKQLQKKFPYSLWYVRRYE